MIKSAFFIFFIFCICFAEDEELKKPANNEEITNKPSQKSNHSLILAAATSVLTNFESIDLLEIGYLYLLTTTYDADIFTSVGAIQEYGYSNWRDQNDTYPFLYGKIGVETGFFNRLFFDAYFGAYVGLVPLPMFGIRLRYPQEIIGILKIEIGGDLIFTPERGKLHNIHIGIVLF
jgi:hypothetical protein